MKNVPLDKVLSVLEQEHLHHAPKKTSLNSAFFSGITVDSRAVKPGYIFVALSGENHHGEDFIPAAIKNGAIAVVCSENAYQEFESVFSDIRFFTTAHPMVLCGKLAALFYPNRPKFLLGVTGTNGKSSVVDFVRQLLEMSGVKSASIGTIGTKAPGYFESGTLTTPDVLSLNKMLHELGEKGVECVALEVSSHGLAQGRVEGILFDAAGFTNLSRDHLDYHKTFQHYFEAKQELFKKYLKKEGVAVLNADIPEYQTLKSVCSGRQIISYGKVSDAIHLNYIQAAGDGQKVAIEFLGKKYQFLLPLPGRFQVLNVLCALGLIHAVYPQHIETILENLGSLQSVPGRLEYVGRSLKGGRIYVDFAHSPDGLLTALQALRHHTPNRLHVIFGCGGNRDKGKRPMMGEVAQSNADVVIVTDDNPRYENPEAIRAEIMVGCPSAKNIGGRREAIREAIRDLYEGDVLLIAGKGHENSQKIAAEEKPFHDPTVVKEILKELLP